MSEYADIRIRKMNLWTFRNYLDKDCVSLFFSKSDLEIISANDEQEIQEDELFLKNKYKYKTIVQCAKERLDVLGYGIDKLEVLFNSNKYQAIDYTAFMNHMGNKINDYEEYKRERIDKKITFKKWKNAMNKIVSYELDNGKINCWDDTYGRSFCTECEKVILYALKDYTSDSYYAINTEIIPLPYIFRLILESCENDDVIELDFSYLSYWDNDCIPKALEATEAIEKTIVLVEGTSDKNILEFSMSKLFPHLSDLFYFMDFGDNATGKRDSGASYIVKNLKTFYFSKINCRFIAVFDNDAVGFQSLCTLFREIKAWPENFRIILYPEIKLFDHYPTISPNGRIVNDDINKKACSIELYLPDSIIKLDGEYYPIEWEARKNVMLTKGEEMSLYQGVISNKDKILKKYKEYQKSIEIGESSFVEEDWQRMKCLLTKIVYAFAKG